MEVLGAQDPLEDGHQGGELVTGPGRIPRHPGPASDFVSGGQGAGVLRPVGVIFCIRVSDQLVQITGRRVAAAIPEIPRDPPHASASQVKDHQGVRQQHRTHRSPGSAPGTLTLGHFAGDRWQRWDGGSLPEMFIAGEGLDRGAVGVLGTALHEAAHGAAVVRGIQDSSSRWTVAHA
jgi:hypothetical protein